MGTGMTSAILVGALLAAPLAGGEVTGELELTDYALAAVRGDNPVATHALSGVVKSVDATMLVITRTRKSPGEMTFVLSPTTVREGPIRAGARVQVRFRMEGRTQVATAILATPPKHPGEKAP
jgi:hypothetical protein